jgi:hypothetical protein
VSPVKYELGFYIPEDDILHSPRRENLKSYLNGSDDGIYDCELMGLWAVAFVRNCKYIESRMLRSLDVFPSLGEGRETQTLLGPLDRADHNQCTTISDPTE